MNSVWHGIIILQRDCRCDSRQFEDYTEEEEQRDWKKEETNKATYDANILLHQLHTGRIVLERVHRHHWCLFVSYGVCGLLWFACIIWRLTIGNLSSSGNSRILQKKKKKKNRETGRKKKQIRQHMMPTSSYTNCTQVELCWRGCTETIVCLFVCFIWSLWII